MALLINPDVLPKICQLSPEQLYDDLFVCALGFEKRCTGALAKLAEWNYRARKSVVLRYDVHDEDNKANYSSLVGLLKKITLDQTRELHYKTSNIPASSDEITSAILDGPIKGSRSVSVDISSFSTSAIIQTLDILLTSGNYAKVRVIYTEAQEYYPKSVPSSSDEEILSSGVREILTLPNFSGIYTPGYSPRLVILLGFEPIRARGVLQLFQPARKTGIIGIPSRSDLMWRVDLAKTMYQNFFESQDEILELSEFDYRQVYLELEKLYVRFAQKNNIAIAPLGSKMQTLAVLLFLQNHPDVQLLVTIPLRYDPRRYTEGVGNSYQIVFERKSE